jgi:hypothetical protein
MRLATTQPEILIEASKQEKVHSFSKVGEPRIVIERMTYAEALGADHAGARADRPYLHGKKPVAIVHDFSGLRDLVIEGVTHSREEVDDIVDADFIAIEDHAKGKRNERFAIVALCAASAEPRLAPSTVEEARRISSRSAYCRHCLVTTDPRTFAILLLAEYEPRNGSLLHRRLFLRSRPLVVAAALELASCLMGDCDGPRGNDPAPPPHLTGAGRRCVHAQPRIHLRDRRAGRLGQDVDDAAKAAARRRAAGRASGRTNGIIRRKARCGVIRESYPNIEANVLPSWFNLVPEEEGKFNWRAPYVHTFSKVLRRDKETTGSRSTSSTWNGIPRDRRQVGRGNHPRLGNQRRRDRRIRPAAARADQLPVGPRRPLLQHGARAWWSIRRSSAR